MAVEMRFIRRLVGQFEAVGGENDRSHMHHRFGGVAQDGRRPGQQIGAHFHDEHEQADGQGQGHRKAQGLAVGFRFGGDVHPGRLSLQQRVCSSSTGAGSPACSANS